MRSVPDLTGQRFGRRIVLARAGSRRARARWLCRCDCGTEAIVDGIMLRAGKANSCKGCGSRVDRVGQRIGRLEVQAWDKDARKWRCRCSCGVVSLVSAGSLTEGRARSCGCLQREKARGRIKHSADVVARIHELRKHGFGYDRISRALGVPKSTVRAIIKGFIRAEG